MHAVACGNPSGKACTPKGIREQATVHAIAYRDADPTAHPGVHMDPPRSARAYPGVYGHIMMHTQGCLGTEAQTDRDTLVGKWVWKRVKGGTNAGPGGKTWGFLDENRERIGNGEPGIGNREGRTGREKGRWGGENGEIGNE